MQKPADKMTYYVVRERAVPEVLQKVVEAKRLLDRGTAATVQEAADYCGYSTSYFMRFFKSFTGSTFITYLNTCRLQKAEELLLTSQYSVLEISGMSGFENHSYFIRLFKRCDGITPCQYRLMHE